jgi:uncharacterized Ntn-hydrolase superfamily protein
MFGIAVTTSSIAVGSRCAFAKPGIGAVLTQHRTDPRLGALGIELLSQGKSAQQTIDALVASTPHHAWRHLAGIDRARRTAYFSGTRIASVHAAAEGDGVVAIGNILKNASVPRAEVDGFAAHPGQHLAERLLHGLKAGLDAGGEIFPLRSAALLVVDRESFPLVDLRIDDDLEPVAALRRLWHAYEPYVEDFVVRALDPEHVGPATGEARDEPRCSRGKAVARGKAAVDARAAREAGEHRQRELSGRRGGRGRAAARGAAYPARP